MRKILNSQTLTVTVNLLGLPSVLLPLGVQNDLPQTVQVNCPMYTEMQCLALGKIKEDEVGIFTPISPK